MGCTQLKVPEAWPVLWFVDICPWLAVEASARTSDQKMINRDHARTCWTNLSLSLIRYAMCLPLPTLWWSNLLTIKLHGFGTFQANNVGRPLWKSYGNHKMSFPPSALTQHYTTHQSHQPRPQPGPCRPPHLWHVLTRLEPIKRGMGFAVMGSTSLSLSFLLVLVIKLPPAKPCGAATWVAEGLGLN